MSTYRLTPAARRDLLRIWDYSEERWGLQQAEVYLRDLQTCLERLADDPCRGHPRDSAPETRYVPATEAAPSEAMSSSTSSVMVALT